MTDNNKTLEEEINKYHKFAFSMLLDAIQQKNPDLHYQLGNFCKESIRKESLSNENMDALCYTFYNLAALEGHEEAKKARDDFAKQMTPEQIKNAKNLVENWMIQELKNN